LSDTPKRDPLPRSEGDINGQLMLLRSLDPARVYCVANPGDFYCGVAALKGLGWSVEMRRKDGPRVLGDEGAKDGEPLMLGDQMLMSRPRAMQEEYERGKAAVADQRAEAIGQKGGVDRIGIPG